MTANILNAISDNNALVLFKTIAIGNYDTDALRSKLKLTEKQYYLRLGKLMKTGLIKRKNGKYLLTSLGKVAFYCEKVMECAVKDYWRLMVIDAVEIDDKIQAEDCAKFIDILICNKEIKDILLSEKESLHHTSIYTMAKEHIFRLS